MKPDRLRLAALVAAAGLAASTAVSHGQAPEYPETIHRVADNPLPATRAEISRLRLDTERVAVFKDGYALIVKTAAAVADDRGRVFTDEVPDAAVLGCFWATTTQGQIAAMRAELITTAREETSEAACLTMTELLRANTDRRVVLTLRDAERSTIDATILRVLETPPVAAGTTDLSPGPTSLHTPTTVGTVRTPLAPRGGQYVIVRSGAAETILPIDHIHSIAGEQIHTSTTHRDRVERTSKRLSFELGSEAAGKPVSLRIMYFTPGMRWIPTYRLSINPDNRSGVLALQGELLNECEDISAESAVALDMVVGVPNFRFRNTVSPLVMEKTLRNALLSAAPDIMGRQNQYSNAMFAQRAGEWRDERAEAPVAGADLAPELSASGEQDLFVYSIPRFGLKRGERATVPVLRQDVRFDHLYTLDIAAVRDARRQGSAQYSCRAPGAPHQPLVPPLGESPSARTSVNHVWHQIELWNASSAPWTTGAALVMGAPGGDAARVIPIAQDLLRYTPAGGKVLLPLTIAVDIRADLDEEEIGRTDNALHRNGTSYALVRGRSTITLASSRREPSSVRVTLALGGKALEASDEGRIVITGHSGADWGGNDPGPVNNHSDITWEVQLAPGESRNLTVEFSYYTF